MGGLEAQLPFSVEGLNIPEGLHNKPMATPCHLKLSVFTPASETHDSVAFEHSKKSKASRMAQVLKQNPSTYLSIYWEAQ